MKIKKGFTFIEILVVMAVLVVLAAIVMLILNPAEYLRRARDAQRLGDAARINQAMALYNYGAASQADNNDGDGPRFPLAGSPPTTDSCITDPNQRIFVSVPSDNGESNPTPPSGWTYSRVTSTQLRSIDGSGWLPVNFMDTSTNQTPFSVLPVDPVNTFASGYFYSYGCGSWNINMRFESEKYQEFATKDQGRFAGVYEIGSNLNVLPEQDAYSSSTVSGSVTPGTYVFRPAISGPYLGTWVNHNYSASYLLDESNSTFIEINKNNTGKYYTFYTVATTATGTIDQITFKITSRQTDAGGSFKIKPHISLDGGTYFLNNSGYTEITPAIGSTFTESSVTIPTDDLNWSSVNSSQFAFGFILTGSPATGTGVLQITKIEVNVDYR